MEKTTYQELKHGSQPSVGIGEALLDKMAIKLGLNNEKVVGKRESAEKEICKIVKHDQIHQVRQSNMSKGDYNYFYITKECFREGNGTPLQCSCLENPMDRGAWQATVHRVAKNWTRLSN